MKTLEQEKSRFAENEILFLVFQSALARGFKVYAEDASEQRKNDFKIKFLSGRLQKYAKQVRERPDHITDTISAFQNEVNMCEYTDVLKEGKLTFGRVQKLLNLYLKYHWIFSCEQDEPHPPHCPIDSIILGNKEIKWVGPRWTKPQFTQDRYFEAIELCRKAAREQSIAEWELRTFRNRSDSKY